jgi:hypothetical protein
VITDELVTGLRDTLQRIAAWHRTPEVVVRQTYPAKLQTALTGRPRARRAAVS